MLYEVKEQPHVLLLSQWVSKGYKSTSAPPSPKMCMLCGNPNGSCTSKESGGASHGEPSGSTEQSFVPDPPA